MTQEEALEVAGEIGLYLEGLGGTNGGIIGALAAVGLGVSGDDGRVVFLENQSEESFCGNLIVEANELFNRGVERIECFANGGSISSGRIDLGKRLRPNLRKSKVVLYVQPSNRDDYEWTAVRFP